MSNKVCTFNCLNGLYLDLYICMVNLTALLWSVDMRKNNIGSPFKSFNLSSQYQYQ